MARMADAPTTVRIRALAHGGAGVGEPVDAQGPTWFVPGALPGEVVRAEVEHAAKRHVRGRLLEVLESSPDRVAPPCPLAEQCGGCAWQHVDPEAQVRLKRDIVVDQLRRVVDASRVRVAYSGKAGGYRRRARMHYERGEDGRFVLGFHPQRSHGVLDVPKCPVLVRSLDTAFQKLREAADVLPNRGEVLGLSDGTNTILGLPGVAPEPERMARLEAQLDSNLVGIEVRGGRKRAHVGQRTLDIDGWKTVPPLRVSAFVFVQARKAGGQHLVREVVRAAKPDALRVLELFAGAGNFSRALAQSAHRVWASDTDREAIDALRNLAAAHELPINAKRQSAPLLLPKLAEKAAHYEVVVLDPPRIGLGEAATAAMCRIATERIVYVSCDPATLARDLAVAIERGFSVTDVAVLDLMPMTPEVEVVATLSRKR